MRSDTGQGESRLGPDRGGLVRRAVPERADPVHHPLLLHHRRPVATAFPPPGLTTKWFGVAFAPRRPLGGARSLAAAVAFISMLIALILGTLAAAAMFRFRFFGETVTLLILLPIALPGIVTGMSLRAAFDLADLPFSFWTLVRRATPPSASWWFTTT